MIANEAQCPYCHQWSETMFDGIGHWWKDSAGCPRCGAIVLVETECGFRERKADFVNISLLL